MVKYCLKKYPMGSFKGQRSPGRYMDGYLYKNLEMLADKITKDMTFLGIIFSSTLEVGTGKSVFATQIGEAWTELINKKYKINLNFEVDNVVWRPKELMERAFQVPKYSYVLLDEWEDSHYWSELGITLRQFFRKCRQLNLFIMCIIPNWFQLPLNYAISRSIFAIDVRFNNNLDRGFFSFYNFPSKRILYIQGKKNHNYKISRPTFYGRFPDGYGVDELSYRKKKFEDMIRSEQEEPEKFNKQQIENRLNIKILQNYLKIYPKSSLKECGDIFKVSKNAIMRWKKGTVDKLPTMANNYNIEPIIKNKEIIVNEDELEELEKQRSSEYIEEDVQEEQPLQ